ncbi:MAG: hypothetical protein IJW03_05120 [Clostridia bacterium]|nr:hypothetical protein [Clostridia bacterium]
MKKSTFNEKYGITDAKPTSLAVIKTTISSFTLSVEQFFKSRFDGLVVVETEFSQHNSDYITICAEQTAYFFKLLLTYLQDEAVIRIKMSCDAENKFIIKIESDGFKSISSPELYEIVRSAKSAKFIPYETERGILLKRPYKTSISYRVYATSPRALADAFEKIFFSK